MSPAAKPKVKKQDQDFSFLTLAEVDAVIHAVADDYLRSTDRTLILTAAYTGLRQGELLALRWSDLLWTRSKLNVRASVSRGVEGTTKSETSRRKVSMPDRVARVLELHHQTSAYKTDSDRVFAHPHTGRPYDASKQRDRFYDAMTAAGYEHMIGRDGGGIVFHSLRHTFGTVMASRGVPIVAIKEAMGHAKIETTMIYAKWANDDERDREIANSVFGAEPTSVETASPTSV